MQELDSRDAQGGAGGGGMGAHQAPAVQMIHTGKEWSRCYALLCMWMQGVAFGWKHAWHGEVQVGCFF